MNNLFIFYLLIINILGFIFMYIDKEKAKKHKWRISENTLIILSLLGGSIGSFIGMNKFRHKTKHIKFKYGIPLIIIFQIIFIYLIVNK
ncbi:DUF1294 domain-containing protein [Clostridium sp.]|uniref:DUF1294 domain-containing protein n=1 Tax=Clostridium sp. TaxID=1506 RepID=UPI0026DA8EE6|nr:DUF1294 domain-containing protein [Clostridium sp.]MDO5038993.1 DUF1294 domain-containing protein [Clostridium sp.]